MATKINVRSPFYLNITEPTAVTPLFDCDVANIQGLTIDQQGQISTPSLSFGQVDTITSTDSDFSNNKFATESVATDRTLTIRVLIPPGFSNTADGFIDCPKVVTQPAVSCSDGPTTNGSIPAQSINVGGSTATINLASYFTQGTLSIAGYNIYNPDRNLVNASVSGNTLTLSSNTIGGSTTVVVSAFDNGSNTCTASQTISVTISNPTVTFDCTAANLTGGSIAQDGTIVKPNTFADVGTIRTTSGDASTNITSYSANTSGSARNVTLFFDITAPAGYSNAGATVECSKTFSQPAADPTFTCDIANLSGQQISSKGSILKGNAQIGTISSFTPIGFDIVTSDTPRDVTFNVTPPATGYSNSGGADIPCVKTITQPGELPDCGSNTYFISGGKSEPKFFCDEIYNTSKEIKSDATSISNATGSRVCLNDSPFDGRNRYYGVSTTKVDVGSNISFFNLWQIDSNGIVQRVETWNCTAGTDGNGVGGPV